MANKRSLKKQIHYICGDVASEALLSKYLIENADGEALDKVMIKAADLKETALKRVNISYDKTVKDFDNAAQYRHARRKYFHTAYAKLIEGFSQELVAIVKDLNAAMPKKA